MKRLHITFNSILDLLFIVVFSVGYVSILKFVTYAIFSIPESVQLFLFLTILYFIRFKDRSYKGKVFSGKLVSILFVLYIWEIIQGLIVGADYNWLLVCVVNLFSVYVAYKYLSNLVLSKNSIDPVINSYSVYMYYTLFVVIVSSFLILSSLMNPYSNQLGMNSLFKTNMEESNVYYFPGYLSLVYGTPSIFLSRFNFPSLSGLSHESQAMYITIYPALFLQLYKNKKRNTDKTILFIFLLTTVLTTSLTAAICFIITYILHLIWKLNDKSQTKSALLILFIITLFVLYVVKSQFSSIISAFIQEKANFDTIGSSGSYSISLLSYFISPTGLLGQGIFSSTAEQGMQGSLNCGYISSILIVSFYLFFIYNCIKNIFAEDVLCHAIGLASIYFVMHSFKYGVQVFNNTYIFFIVFLLTYANNRRLKEKEVIEVENLDYAKNPS